MDTIRKIIAGICAILFIITGVVALLAFNIEQKAFASATYKQAFERQKLYERMPEILANTIFSSIANDPNGNSYLKSLKVADWQKIITSLLPPIEIKAVTDSTLDSVFDYINGNSNSASISLLPFKTHLVGASGVEVVQQILQVQPACTAEQLLQLGLGLLSGNVQLCNPPEELMGLMTPLIESQLQVLTVAIPNEITLISAPSDAQNDQRTKLDRARTLMKITPVFPLLFLFITTIFAVRSLTDWLKWWGYPFFIIGAISSLFALLGSPILGLIVRRVLQNQFANFVSPILFATLQETVSAVSQQILNPVLIEGLVIAGLGAGMALTTLVVTYINKKRSR